MIQKYKINRNEVPSLEIRAIRTFATIVKYGNFLKAAEALNYSQPTITLHIKHLEGEIGKKLIERGKSLKLTEAGKLFYERANALLREYDRLDKTLQDLEVGVAGIIRLGVSEPTASFEFPAIIADFKRKYPQIEITIHIADANTLSTMLYQDKIDFAICGAPEVSLDNIFKPLFYDDIVLLMADNNPLSTKTLIRIDELVNETFIFTPHNCPIRIKVEQSIIEAIGTSYKKLEVSSSMSHKYFVQAGLGISLFTRTAHSMPLPGTKIVEMDGIDASPPIGILRRTNDTTGKATKHLIELIEDSFAKKSADFLISPTSK